MIFYESFNYPNGTTNGSEWQVGVVGECDENSGIFSVQNGRFQISDIEGLNCCNCLPGNIDWGCGDNSNTIEFGPFDITGQCYLNFDIPVSLTGNLECPDFLTRPECNPGSGTDQMILSYTLNGESEFFLPMYCGSWQLLNLQNIDIPVKGKSSMSFKIYSGTQSTNESYFIEHIQITGIQAPTNLSIIQPEETIYEGDTIVLNSIVSNCAECGYVWKNESGIALSLQNTLTIDSIERDGDDMREFELKADNGNCPVSTFIQIQVLLPVPAPPALYNLSNTNLFINGFVKGLVMKSPNSFCWQMTVNNGGDFQVIQTTCDPGTNLSLLEIGQGQLFIEDFSHGFILKSPDGQCHLYTMNDSGMIQSTDTSCNENINQSLAILESSNVFLNGIGQGLVLKSPNDNCWQIQISNIGEIEVISIDCPIN